MSATLVGPEAAAWVWRALWEERKRRQKNMNLREESGQSSISASVAPKPLHLRLLDAVLFEHGASTPTMGVFTSRQGELMRRTAASLDLATVRGRMAQVSLGVFGGSGGVGADGGGVAIAVAHLSDGSLREVAGGADWDRIVGAGARSGALLALTPWACGTTAAADSTGRAWRVRNFYRVIAEGSQFGKVSSIFHLFIVHMIYSAILL